MTRAELVAKAIVKHLIKDMSDPKFRGPNFDPLKFDIEKHVDVHIYTNYHYKTKVPKESREKALKLARELWIMRLKTEH